MAGPYGGHTILGDTLNKQQQTAIRGNIDKQNVRRAIIKKSYNNTYFFIMKLVDDPGAPLTKPIRLIGENHYLAQIGEPNEFVGKEVLIIYKGNSVNRGRAQLIGDFGATMATEVHNVEMANKLEVEGTSFAPPIPV